MSLQQAISERRILISVGTGGVGKTTISAAMAIRAALEGRRVLVITIDPAKRLVTSLGMTEFEPNSEVNLSEQLKEACQKAPGKPECKGELWVVIPDTHKTFHQMVQDVAGDAASAERVLRNPIFDTLTREFSGANEYMAVQRLDQLYQTGNYDLIVLDTPPSRSALAFLDAPSLLSRFFEEKLIRWLVIPANKIATAGMRKALKLLEKLTGSGFVQQLYDFMAALFEVQTGITGRLDRIKELLGSDEVGFVLVTTPSPENLTDFQHLRENIEIKNFRFEGLILNRSLKCFSIDSIEVQNAAGSAMEAALKVVQDQQEKEESFLAQTGATPSISIRELARDVHSIDDLLYIAREFDDLSQD